MTALHVEVSGSGPDLVLLHGWGMHGAVWREVATALSRSYRVHVADLPGYGLSPSCHPYTLDALVEKLAAAFPPRICLCGWSLGGQLAAAWALRFPSQIERLALVAATPRFTNGEGWEFGIG
ncbi:MAG: alpha/beta fold hydrolase, partial [Burkholderiales bacterium]